MCPNLGSNTGTCSLFYCIVIAYLIDYTPSNLHLFLIKMAINFAINPRKPVEICLVTNIAGHFVNFEILNLKRPVVNKKGANFVIDVMFTVTDCTNSTTK